MVDQDHGPRLPQRLPMRARKSTSSALRSQIASASGNAQAAPPKIKPDQDHGPRLPQRLPMRARKGTSSALRGQLAGACGNTQEPPTKIIPDQDHGPRLPQRLTMRAQKGTSSALRSQLTSACGNAQAVPPPLTSLSAILDPYPLVAGMPIPRSAQLPSLSANPRVHGGAAMESLVPSDPEPTEGRVRTSQAGGGSFPLEQGTKLPASTARRIGATESEVQGARPYSTSPNMDVPYLLRLQDREARTPSLSSAFSRCLMDFPKGFEIIPTSGEGYMCGFGAVINTMTAMHPSLPRPTVKDLQNVLNSSAYVESTAEFGLTNTDNFHVDQIGAALYFWGTIHHGLNLQLGYIPSGQIPQLVPHPNEDPTIVIWISNDNAQLLEDQLPEDQTLMPTILNHFSGVKPLKDKDSDDSDINEQNDQSDVRATPSIALSESPALVEESEVLDVLMWLAPSNLPKLQDVSGGNYKRREREAEHDQASRKKQAYYCTPESRSQTGEGAAVSAVDPTGRQTRGEADAAPSRGTDSGRSEGAAVQVEGHPYTHAVVHEIDVRESYINKCQGELSPNKHRFPDSRVGKHKAILRILKRRQQTLAGDIKEMERMPRPQEYGSTVRRILDQSKDPESRHNLFRRELEGLVRCEITPDNKSMIAELICVIKEVIKVNDPVPRSPGGRLVRTSARKAAASFTRYAAESRLEDNRTRARIRRARQERAARVR
ncbi:hypothetical protein EPUS_00570 [Endocarpon pusillum Z07020]|uniref:Uncharacterized protein n=1 Tax=Endocarpon pusillum (strain Z07020 / HMAS-L-300199) TaxID=1263415 RepID=U1GIE8_ENDPU|nr:uncharacterized protein EPUS_00570 [Endocarpon pusillum Z07020]ERF71581.1 hypothetical protein EPUS_00570 [Endocarpon pusillum Z07020]